MNKLEKFTIKHTWVLVSILYVLFMLYAYFNTKIIYMDIELPQHDAGMWGVIFWHVFMATATLGAYIIHWIVELISLIFRKIKK